MKTEKIGSLEAISLITIVIINKVILVLPEKIIANTGSSAWLNTLYVSILAILVTCLITVLFNKFSGYDIFDISNFLGGSILKKIIQITYILALFIVPIYVLKNIAETLKIIYFRTSPLTFVLLFFLVSTLIANFFSIKVLAKTNIILMVVSFSGIALILISSIQYFSFDRLFPILGYGAKSTFVSGLSSLFSFSGIGYLFLLNPLLDKPSSFKRISIVSIIISGAYLFLTVTCILLSFSFAFKGEEIFSLYLLTRNIGFGRFIQRIDAIFILMWIVSIIIYISFIIYFIINILKKLINIQNTKRINIIIHALLFIILLIPTSLAKFNSIMENLFQTSVFVVIFGISILILVLANIKLKILNNRKDSNISI